jgi:leucyl aminopeptidase
LPISGQGNFIMQLPEFSTLDLKQSPSPLTKTHCDKLDHVAVILPKKPARASFKSLPHADHLRRSFERGSDKGIGRAASRLANKPATGVTIATLDDTSPYALLRWARLLIADCSKEKPARLGVATAGLDDAARERALQAIVAAAEAAAFELPTFKSDAKTSRRAKLRTLTVFDAKPRLDFAATRATALGNNIARWLTALPPNELTSASYQAAVKAIATQHRFKYAFLDEAALGKLGAGAFLAVSQGNVKRDAGIIHLKYRPHGNVAPDLALVGKGILFDTGGTNLKPFKGMLDMHTDMQGSAVALGSLVALATLQVPYAIDLWLAVTENRLSGTAYVSQDVVTASNGTTIQVMHTDAEGRMVLADALAIAAKEKPKLMIDYATLTGSCVVAVTSLYSGVFSNRGRANAVLQQAGQNSGERVWPFPMDDDFEEALRSEIADIKQCTADSDGDHILAARFLMRFVPKDIAWMHVDLSAGQHKGGLAHVPTDITGFGVRLTVELLQAANSAAELAAQIES